MKFRIKELQSQAFELGVLSGGVAGIDRCLDISRGRLVNTNVDADMLDRVRKNLPRAWHMYHPTQ